MTFYFSHVFINVKYYIKPFGNIRVENAGLSTLLDVTHTPLPNTTPPESSRPIVSCRTAAQYLSLGPHTGAALAVLIGSGIQKSEHWSLTTTVRPLKRCGHLWMHDTSQHVVSLSPRTHFLPHIQSAVLWSP